jgi:hypothetical protein
MVSTDSTGLTPAENRYGVNLAYLSLKLAHMELGNVQKELREKGLYSLSDKVREVRAALEAGYSHRMGPISD